jgi:endonuclease YncB( thermonuclease family)
VIDGDTMEVRDSLGHTTRVRLRNVNAPELGTPEGYFAAAFANAIYFGKQVRCDGYARDVYGRLVADVILESAARLPMVSDFLRLRLRALMDSSGARVRQSRLGRALGL